MSRKKPCTPNPDLANLHADLANLHPPQQICTPPQQNCTFEDKNYGKIKQFCMNDTKTCEFCLKVFCNKQAKKRHIESCKQKNDPTRMLEVEQGIIPIFPDKNNECRFCNKEFCRINEHLKVCKEKEKYHQILLKDKVNVSIQTQNNVTNNVQNQNNVTNNVQNQQNNNNIILNFGQENLNHIQTENIINLLREIRKEYGDNQVYLMAGNLVDSFDNYIRENSQNQNIVIPSCNSQYGNIKTERGWEKVPVDKCLNKAFKHSAKELYKKKESIQNCNEKVFKSETNQQIFSEVKQFANNGLNGNNEETRQLKSSFKIGKLKDRVLDF